MSQQLHTTGFDVPRQGQTRTSYLDVDEVFRQTLLIDDPHVLPLVLATVLSHFTDGDPIWLRLIWASGGGKTEFINALQGVPEVYPLSSLTPNTLFSGFEREDGGESSLLVRLGSPILTLKDFTSILSKRNHDQREILGQLREIYDGQYTKTVGTGKEVVWRGKVTLIAGSTPAIDGAQGRMANQELGERFLDYRMQLPDRLELAEAAMQKSGSEEDDRYVRALIVERFIEGHRCQGKGPKVPEEVEKVLPALADFATRARSVVPRSGYTKDIAWLPEPEVGTRMVKQLLRLAESLLLVSENLPLYPLVHKVAMDSIPRLRWKVLCLLSGATEPIPTGDIAKALGPSLSTVERTLEDLVLLGIAERHQGRHSGLLWSLKPGAPDLRI